MQCSLENCLHNLQCLHDMFVYDFGKQDKQLKKTTTNTTKSPCFHTDSSIQPLKYMPTFSIIHSTSLKFPLWFLCVCYALLSRLKQISPMPQITVANTLAVLFKSSSDMPVLTAIFFDWLSLFLLVPNEILNVIFPFWDS